MRRFVNYFFQGLIFLVPIVLTAWFADPRCFWRSTTSCAGSSARRSAVWGSWFAIAAVTGVGPARVQFSHPGIVAAVRDPGRSSAAAEAPAHVAEDLMSAFVGEKRRFNQPVLVEVVEGSGIRAVGFVTHGPMAKFRPSGRRGGLFSAVVSLCWPGRAGSVGARDAARGGERGRDGFHCIGWRVGEVSSTARQMTDCPRRFGIPMKTTKALRVGVGLLVTLMSACATDGYELDDLGRGGAAPRIRSLSLSPGPYARTGQVQTVQEVVQRTRGNPAGGALAGALIGGLLFGGHGPSAWFGAASGAAVGAAASQGDSESRTYELVVALRRWRLWQVRVRRLFPVCSRPARGADAAGPRARLRPRDRLGLGDVARRPLRPRRR